jgi:hypothetical protein
MMMTLAHTATLSLALAGFALPLVATEATDRIARPPCAGTVSASSCWMSAASATTAR